MTEPPSPRKEGTPSGFDSQLLSQVLPEFEKATEWLSGLGIRWQTTRFRRYLDLTRQFAHGSAKERNALLDLNRQALYNSTLEANDLLTIYSGLAGAYEANVRDRVQTFIAGPDSYAEERSARNSSNRARNIAFELRLLALLTRAGLVPDFSVRGDVAGRYGQRAFVLECKRPQSHKQIHARIRDAEAQLRITLGNLGRSRTRGVVAIDTAKIVNPFLAVPSYQSRTNLARDFNIRMRSIGQLLKVQFSKQLDRRIIAIMAYHREVGMVPSQHGPDPYTAEGPIILFSDDARSGDLQVLSELVGRIRPPYHDASQEAPV